MVKIHENKGENTKVKMQSFEGAAPEFKCKSSQALKDNSLDSSIHLTRMYKKLPECFVVLHRLTEEDLYKSYPSYPEDNYDKSDELCKKVEAMYASKRKDGRWRSLRKTGRANASAFESYKKTREKFLSRRKRVYHSENSLDMSQDESRNFSDDAKPKKKLKRGRRYERDFEWRPDGSSDSDRRLRARTSMIESDSSSSSFEDDFMYDEYYDYMDENVETDSYAVPSEHAISTATAKNSELEKQSSDKNCFSHQNSSPSSTLNSSSQKIDSVACDIVSDIIKSMDNQYKNNRFKTSLNTLHPNYTQQSKNFKGTEQKKHKRPRILSRNKTSETDPNKIIAKTLKEIVSKVSSKLKHPVNKTCKPMKNCKWCNTPFQPNRNSDVNCAICTDLRNGEVSKTFSSNKKPSNMGNTKCLKENKGKKSNSALSRVLKNLSEHEKQRLIYSEKSDKVSASKGYNHLKSLTSPKIISNSDSDKSSNLNYSQNKISNKLSLNKISSTSNKKTDKANVNSYKSDKITIQKTPVISEKHENKQNKSCVSFENYKEGLFLMTFPEPDEEIDFDGKLSKSRITKSRADSKNAENLNNKQPTKTESLSSNVTQSQSVSTTKYDTYLFPPLPTVIVSNYCSDTSSLNLSNTYFQNEITHQQAIKNSTTASNAVNSKMTISNSESNAISTVTPISNAIVYPNSLITDNLQSSNSVPITSFPVSTNSLNQFTIKSVSSLNHQINANNLTILSKTSAPTSVVSIYPKTSVSANNTVILPKTSISANNVTILPKISVPASNVILPIVTSVMSLSDKSITQTDKVKEIVPSSFSADNFVNSQLCDIRINNVTSLQTYETSDRSLLITDRDINKHLPPDLGNQQASAENISHSSVKRKRLNSDRYSSDYSDSSHQEDITNNLNVIEKDNTSAFVSDNQSPNLPEKDIPNRLNNNDQTEQTQLTSNESDKSLCVKENAAAQTPVSATQSAIDLLGAISILAVIDLEKNPQLGLNCRIQVTKSQLNKLAKENPSAPEHNERLASCQYNLQLLNIAKKYLTLYGSFIKVSEHLLRKANMIKIKKELHEEEMNQNSCMFSQPSHPLSERLTDMSRSVEISPAASNQIQNFASPRTNLQTSINHIEKLKSQIAAMNNVNVNIDLAQYGGFPSYGTVHHYPGEQMSVLNAAVAAPTPVTPRNDSLTNESRETPSRGSGPRTPARPESAASQSEDTASILQIKKEQFEANTSPSSQCAFAQNTALPQISSQSPVMPDMSTFNIPQQSIANTSVHLSVNNTNLVYSNQSNYSVHSGAIAPNRTVTYSNHQNYSDMYLNVAAKPQMQITSAAPNTEIRQNQQVILGQQMYIQNGSGLCSKQAVPSVNNNQYVIRPPFTTSNSGGTLIVNNTQVGQNALLTNVSNQQFYTSNQVSQLYYPQSSQMTCMSNNNNIPTMISQEMSATQIQPAEIESPEQMICAVCNKQATLRCKQCARVAYCNTACAKTYWHQRHKMECKPLGS